MLAVTGVGSRKVPAYIEPGMTQICTWLNPLNIIMRSGGADGCDTIVEAASVNTKIFLPWNGFNGRYVDNINYFCEDINSENDLKAQKIASEIIPWWNKLGRVAKLFHTRNIYQVLDSTLDNPSILTIFWAPIINKDIKGGTRSAVRLSLREKIPTVFCGIKNGKLDPIEITEKYLLAGKYDKLHLQV